MRPAALRPPSLLLVEKAPRPGALTPRASVRPRDAGSACALAWARGAALLRSRTSSALPHSCACACRPSQHLAPGGVIVDMTTSDPALAREIAAAAEQRQVAAVDAPVSGGDAGARAASLAIMCGAQLFPPLCSSWASAALAGAGLALSPLYAAG